MSERVKLIDGCHPGTGSSSWCWATRTPPRPATRYEAAPDRDQRRTASAPMMVLWCVFYRPSCVPGLEGDGIYGFVDSDLAEERI